MSEWRNIWKRSIKVSQNAIKNKDKEGLLFQELRNEKDKNENLSYKNDKMVEFEEGIACECLKLYDKAIRIYEIVASKENGLPVKHWRDVAEIFLERCKQKRQGRIYAETFGDNFINKDISSAETLKEIQWLAFYELHSFVFLPDHIRYLAISSMSRIDSEPAMAIVIFRTCLEGVIKILYPAEYEENENDEKSLGHLLGKLFYDKKLFTRENIKTKFEDDKCYILKERGNDAAHGVDVDYNNKYLNETIILFVEIMKKGNDLIEDNLRNR